MAELPQIAVPRRPNALETIGQLISLKEAMQGMKIRQRAMDREDQLRKLSTSGITDPDKLFTEVWKVDPNEALRLRTNINQDAAADLARRQADYRTVSERASLAEKHYSWVGGLIENIESQVDDPATRQQLWTNTLPSVLERQRDLESSVQKHDPQFHLSEIPQNFDDAVKQPYHDIAEHAKQIKLRVDAENSRIDKQIKEQELKIKQAALEGRDLGLENQIKERASSYGLTAPLSSELSGRLRDQLKATDTMRNYYEGGGGFRALLERRRQETGDPTYFPTYKEEREDEAQWRLASQKPTALDETTIMVDGKKTLAVRDAQGRYYYANTNPLKPITGRIEPKPTEGTFIERILSGKSDVTPEEYQEFLSPSANIPTEYKDPIDRAVLNMTPVRKRAVINLVNRLWTTKDIDQIKDVIRQAAIEGEDVTTQHQVEGRRDAISALDAISQGLKDLKAAGVDTNVLRGTAENVARTLGTSTDPRLAAIGTRIGNALVDYRRSMTGVQFSLKESEQYERFFPSYKNTLELNEALIASMRDAMKSQDFNFWKQKLGDKGAALVGEGRSTPATVTPDSVLKKLEGIH